MKGNAFIKRVLEGIKNGQKTDRRNALSRWKKEGLDMYLVPTDDFFMAQRVCWDYFKCRGVSVRFTGSASTLVMRRVKSAVY